MSLTDGAIPALSWKGLVGDGFTYGVRKGKISADQATAWKSQLDSSDLDDLLAAAEFVGRKLGAPTGDLYARWFASVFENVEPTNALVGDAIRRLASAGVPICTLNYDTLLERVTNLPAINLNETGKVTAWMRGTSPGILHLHGIWDTPESCILGIRDYDSTLRNDVRDHFQRSLASFRRLLFIGCGDTFADPNFAALITWLREKLKTATLQHYALVREDEVSRRDADPAWHGFVEPVSYGAQHKDLPSFISNQLIGEGSSNKKAVRAKSKTGVTSNHERLLQDYRTYLLKDCGQMTIEGVRADMDTAQRRFDLERLFVPVTVLPTAPNIPENDVKREEKLRRWESRNKEPKSFGNIFAKHRRLALLALPGGGKTLLLKRLSVAYGDPERRKSSSDDLPDLNLTPVLIRCREWREHIHRPILTLLRSLPDITGHAELAGLNEALLPLFKQGNVLLLVDGLDEIHDDGLRTTFVEHLENFLDEYPLTRLVVTSREAGFNLVAPILARFCERWRVAPLHQNAIRELCDHWHRLMGGDSRESRVEAKEIAQHLLRNESLRRLAENPLLLTMLLVVKHGAGRLPPDRVTLYSRAVEVLLDTWNIKGHRPLNPKEAVPQLAFVAFEMMRMGKQTATERELLLLLEDARESVPQIRRYARDTPDEFLKRVELRSSLLIEAGLQMEEGKAVPFYQFRHLTFQEYLAGVAVTEGHYKEYSKADSVLTPLTAYLVTEEWKEVIPMAAVLARKQAEPLIASLVAQSNELIAAVETEVNFPGKQEWKGNTPKLPAPVTRLISCLAEEAEASSDTLTAALRIIAFFARGCHSRDDWLGLSRGLYGDDFAHQAWLLYQQMDWPEESFLLSTCATISSLRQPAEQWMSSEGQMELRRMLESSELEEIGQGLFVLVGSRRGRTRMSVEAISPFIPIVESHIYHPDPGISTAAMWVWSLQRHRTARKSRIEVNVVLLIRLMETLLSDTAHPATVQRSASALNTHYGIPRSSWAPLLTKVQKSRVRKLANGPASMVQAAALFVAFHAADLWPDDVLARRLTRSKPVYGGPRSSGIDSMLEEIGASLGKVSD